jgi:RNA polymerase sigma factor (sigma-70 family)
MHEPPDSDADLLRVFGERGHEAESDRFVERFRGLVFAVCFRILRDQYLAEDAAQETWKRIVRKKDTYDGQREVSAWLTRIAQNAAIDQHRRKATRQKHTSGDFAYAEQTASAPADIDHLDSDEQRDRLLEEIRHLPVDQQAVLFLVSNENRCRPGLGYATQAATAAALDYRRANGEVDHNRVNRLLASAHATLLQRLSDTEDLS